MEKEQKQAEVVEKAEAPLSDEAASALEAELLQGADEYLGEEPSSEAAPETPAPTPESPTSEALAEDALLTTASDVDNPQLQEARDDDEDGMALMQEFMDGYTESQTRYEIGEAITATVVSIGKQFVFLDVGSKSEASIPLEQTLDEDEIPPAIGDTIEAFIVNINQGNLELGKHLPGTDDAMLALEDAYENRIPVEGAVTGTNKGGLEVMVFGKRAFCPISQVELRFVEDPKKYVGQTLKFRIAELKEGGRNIVLSRRALLEDAQKAEASKIWDRVEEGAEFDGTVQSIKDYGAFIDIGSGVQGLLHVSELSHQRVDNPRELLEEGQQVRVRIIKYSPENDKISFSMKVLQRDPWDEALEKFKVDSIVTGTVGRLQPFGAFVELAPGIDGLIHISQVSHRRINHPKEVLTVGDTVEVKVKSFDRDKRRIGLSLKEISTEGLPPEVEGGVSQGKVLKGIVDKIEEFGIFIRLPDNKRGLLPNAELTAPRGSDLSRVHPPESEIEVMIQNIDPGSGRIRLSQKAIERQKQEREFQEYRQQSSKKEKAAAGFGTLGDLLKNIDVTK